MQKLLKIFFIVLLTLLALTFIAWTLLIKPEIEKHVKLSLNAVTNKDLSSLNVFFLGATINDVFTLDTKPIPIPLDQPSISISPFSLFSLHPKFNFDSGLFGGKLNSNFSYKIRDNSIKGDFSARGLQIAKYQIASLLGFTEGTIDFNIDLIGNSNGTLAPTKAFFLLKNLKKPFASKVPKWINPLEIKLPAIDGGELKAEATCTQLECRSTNLSFKSSLGQASGSFSIALTPDAIPNLDLTVALTGAGRNELLPYFALINQELLSFPDKPFIIKMREQNRKPKLSVVPINDSL